MNRKLLIKKEKRTYIREDESVNYHESSFSLQTITNKSVQVQLLEKENIKYLLNSKISEKFLTELGRNVEIDDYLIELQEKYKITDYEVHIGMEDVLVRKIYLDTESIREIKYGIVTYNIVKSGKLISSNSIVFENNYTDLVETLSKKIDEELEWDKKKKVKCEDIPLVWIFNSEVAGYFFHECIGHVLEEDIFQITNYKIGDMFFKNKLNIYENWVKEDECDDIGNNIKEKICLVHNGKIENILSGYNSKWGICSGNVFTEETAFAPMVRMSNMLVESKITSNNLFTNVKEAIYVEEVSGGECEPFTGEVGLCIKKAYYIKNGKKDIAFEPFSLLFNLQDLKETQIDVGNDKKTIHSLCYKYGAIKKIQYTTPGILIDWRQNSGCITNRNF